MTSLSRTGSEQLHGNANFPLVLSFASSVYWNLACQVSCIRVLWVLKENVTRVWKKSSTLFEKYVSGNVWIQCSFSCVSCWLISMVLEPAILKDLSILCHTSETLCVTPTVAWRECSALMFLIHSVDFCSLWTRLRCRTNVSGIYGCNIRRVSWL